MPRYRLTLEYDGTPFVGWQRQSNGPSVQQAVETAIQAFCGETVTIQGAGRTDAGVHALAQVAHVDLARDWPADTVRDALNHHLGANPIATIAAAAVSNDFNARFGATARHYIYRICNRRARAALDRTRMWWVPVALDADAMHRASQALVGIHDFSTFRAAQCQAKSPVKSLTSIAVTRTGDDEIAIRVSAPSFLHHQVRSITGSLKCVGEGRWPEGRVKEVLEACDRKTCGPVAPACGLYLSGVDYPDGLGK
ncbi:MAG: tRNA pseudouridine(38-40) synthase TruA [Pseudomonadota bacterium]